jgi:hypothetical protein
VITVVSGDDNARLIEMEFMNLMLGLIHGGGLLGRWVKASFY